MNAGEFMSALGQQFPDLVSELDDESWRGLLYVETGCLRLRTQRAIDAGDRDEVRREFEFIRRCWLDGNSEVQNALGVSYLEHLNFNDGKARRAWAFDLLPTVLQEAAVRLGIAPSSRRRV